MTTARCTPARNVVRIATAAGGGFATFYAFYTTASSTLGGSATSAGMQVGIVMLVVVAIQPLLLLGRNWVTDRRLAVMLSLASMGVGSAILPVANQWPGSLLLGLGFGIFVVMSTVWVKEQSAPGQTGRALGVYGFGSAVGGALGAPIGLYAVEQGGQLAVALVGSAFAFGALILARRARSIGTHHSMPEAPPSSGDDNKATASSPARFKTRFTIAVVTISLFGHLLAVSLYATALSSVGQSLEGLMPVLAAFTIQVCLATGRLIGGHLSDRLTPLVVLSLAVVILAVSTASFVITSTELGTLLSVIVIGFASGVGQTGALTALMRRAATSRATEAASAGWNIAFDGGLGIGALAAGWLMIHG